MGSFSRSWKLLKLSFQVIRADTELILFPLLSAFFSLLYIAALVVPLVWLSPGGSEGQGGEVNDLVYYAALFVLYFGLAFVATFFNTCVVYTTKVRFEGGDATFMESLGFALSRIHLIFSWSLVAASVGVLLRALDNAAERSGPIGRAVLGIVRSLLGMAWSVVTIFVVPAMVYRGLGPIDAIKHSIEVLKRTWGESLIRHYGFGLLTFLLSLLGIGVTVGLAFVFGNSQTLIWIPILFAIFYFVAIATVLNLANTIFNVALFTYADTGKVPMGYDQDLIEGAIGSN